MRPSRYFHRLNRQATRRLAKLRLLADATSRLPFPQSDQPIAYVTLELFNTWANIARAYVLSCTLSPRREGGLRVTLSNPVIRNSKDAIGACMQKYKPTSWKKGQWERRDEPAWHNPTVFMGSCSLIGCCNLTEITNAFSIPTNVFRHLPKFRHFYAHRNDYTARLAKDIARSYSISVRLHPTEILCNPAYGRPQALLLDWIDEINLTVQMLCS